MVGLSRLLLVLLLLLVTTAGCGTYYPEQPSPAEVYVVKVDRLPDGGFRADIPEGVFLDIESFERGMAYYGTRAVQKGKRVEIIFGPNMSADPGSVLPIQQRGSSTTSDSKLGTQRSPLYLGGGFTLTVSTGRTYVSGCIHTNAHRVAIHLNRGSDQVFDLHLATYIRDGRKCFGVYESVHEHIDFCTCSPISYEQIRDAIYSAAIAVGASISLANIISSAATPVAIGVFAL